MNRLRECVKRRIVEHLACYNSHAEVADLIREEFGVALAPRHVRAYDPTCFQFAAGRKWQDYHALVRKRFQQVMAEIPISHRAYRLRKLDRVYEEAMDRNDLSAALRALEQAAKEVGNVYLR